MKNLKGIFVYLLLSVFLILTARQFCSIVWWSISHYKLFAWFAAGVVVYFIARKFLKKNEEFLQTFTHELTHTIAGFLFGHKIHSFRASDGNGGEIYHSGRYGGIFIALTPYCLPVYTYVLMLLRLIGERQALYVFDLLTGLTAAFHAVAFFKQIRPYQTDIQSQGYLKSYLFITAFLLFNSAVILLTVRKGLSYAFQTSVRDYWYDIEAFFNFITQ